MIIQIHRLFRLDFDCLYDGVFDDVTRFSRWTFVTSDANPDRHLDGHTFIPFPCL